MENDCTSRMEVGSQLVVLRNRLLTILVLRPEIVCDEGGKRFTIRAEFRCFGVTLVSFEEHNWTSCHKAGLDPVAFIEPEPLQGRQVLTESNLLLLLSNIDPYLVHQHRFTLRLSVTSRSMSCNSSKPSIGCRF